MDYKWYAALAYVRANRLNHNVIEGPNDRFGIIASGKAYNDTRQALHRPRPRRRHLPPRSASACTRSTWSGRWKRTITREFAAGPAGDPGRRGEAPGHRVPAQGRALQLAPRRAAARARQVRRERGRRRRRRMVAGQPEPALAAARQGRPDAGAHRQAIAKRLKKLGVDADIARRHGDAGIGARIDAAAGDASRPRSASMAGACDGQAATARRGSARAARTTPRTVVPEGSRAMAGIGCHYMAVWMDRSHRHLHARWAAKACRGSARRRSPTDKHVFANLGDGTYFHSRPARDPPGDRGRVNITYKILFNDAVAMTGGQPVDGTLKVPEIDARARRRRRRRKIVVVTDEPEKYAGVTGLRAGRRRCTTATSSTRSSASCARSRACTVIIYDQTCATEKRRRRKRGTMADPAKRVVINELVCEGCGDCWCRATACRSSRWRPSSAASARINQSTCNKDYSCLKGFCPSFVTVEGGQLKKQGQGASGRRRSTLPRAARAGAAARSTAPAASSSPASAAPASSRSASCSAWPRTSKARASSRRTRPAWRRRAARPGATSRSANRPDAIRTTRGRHGRGRPRDRLRPDRRRQQGRRWPRCAKAARYVALNTHGTPTAAFVQQPQLAVPGRRLRSRDRRRPSARDQRRRASMPTQLATQLMGDSHLHQPVDARLRLAEGLGAAGATRR